jgi:hypothetical protein
MKKFLFTFFISFCFFLLSGSSHARQECISYSNTKDLTLSGYVSLGAQHLDPTPVFGTFTLFAKGDLEISHIDIEEVENELTTPEKYLKNGHLFPFIFYTLTFGYFLYSIKSNLEWAEDFTYPAFLSNRFITFRSIRI